MILNKIDRCPGTLAKGYSTYNQSCLKQLFNGKKVSHILDYDRSDENDDEVGLFINNRKRISISGVQEKLSLILDGNKLRLTEVGEQGNYILKPIPRDVKYVKEVPANEHLTMQIAKQVYGMKVAGNALVFFKNGDPAYITKRFDIKTNGTKWGVEDFASIAGKTADNGGSNFKYEYSYEKIGELIRENVPAWRVEIEKYFVLVVFNYLFSNGDAHLKNFSLLESSRGDYLLSPAYDLLNTKIHVPDTDFALSKGLFEDGFKSPTFRKINHPSKDDFIEFGKRINVNSSRINQLINPFLQHQKMVVSLVERSFLSQKNKRGYLIRYNEKINYLNK